MKHWALWVGATRRKIEIGCASLIVEIWGYRVEIMSSVTITFAVWSGFAGRYCQGKYLNVLHALRLNQIIFEWNLSLRSTELMKVLNELFPVNFMSYYVNIYKAWPIIGQQQFMQKLGDTVHYPIVTLPCYFMVYLISS